jgi:hypothetical protein
MKNIFKSTIRLLIVGLLCPNVQAQTLVPPTGTDQVWLSTTAGVINGINTALIDYPIARQMYGQLSACAHGATMGTATPVNGVEVKDLTYNTTVSVPYPAGIYDMASVPDVILGNNIQPGHDPNTEFIMAVSFVNNNTPQQIETDFFDIAYTGPGVFTINYNSSQYLPLPAAFPSPLGTVHMDVVADVNTLVFNRPMCDRFFTVFDAATTGGGVFDIFGAYGSLNSYGYILGTTDITDSFQQVDNWQPDVAGVQLKSGAGTAFDAAIFTWVTQGNNRLHSMTWRPLPDVTLATMSYQPAPPMYSDFFAHPRIDANDDYTTNSNPANSNYKIVFEHRDYIFGNINAESYDNVTAPISQLTSGWISIPGTFDHLYPVVAYGAIGSLGNQYLLSETHDDLFSIPGDLIIMQPVEESNPFNVAWGPMGVGSIRYNFIVNNTGGSGGLPTDMTPTNYANAVSTSCNYVSDTSLLSWADFDGTNYNVWYKRSGYDWGSTGHYYRPATFGPIAATDELMVSPNPACKEITVQAEGRYTITEMPGRQIQQGDLYAGKHDIDVQQLPAGNYIITFCKEGAKPVKRKFTKL